MPAVIFSGSEIKALKAQFNLNDEAKILTGDDDPTSVAKDGPKGSLYLRTGTDGGDIYRHIGVGSSTDWVKIGSGGAGGINYIINSDGEAEKEGWASYDEVGVAKPIDGETGGVADQLVFDTTAAFKLRGEKSFSLIPSGVSTGEGVSYDFAIDRADRGKVLSVSFDYEGRGSTWNPDIIVVYLYDVTNGQLIEPSNTALFAGEDIQATYTSEFQTASDSESYRLILHVATAATGWSFRFDNVIVGPQAIPKGVPATEWTAYTPTGGWTTNASYTGFWRRVGDEMEGRVRIDLSGNPTTTLGNFTLPSGYTIDTSKIPSQSFIKWGYGIGRDDGSSLTAQLECVWNSTTTIGVRYTYATATGSGGEIEVNQIAVATPFAWDNTDWLHFHFKVPIVGWSSAVQMSSDAGTRVVALQAKEVAGQSIASGSSTETMAYDTVDVDTHGAISAGVWTCPEAGKYSVAARSTGNGAAGWAAGEEWTTRIYIDGTVEAHGTSRCQTAHSEVMSSSVQRDFDLAAGQTVEIRVFQNNGSAISTVAGGTFDYLSIHKIQGPQAIAATETIAARYFTDTAATISSATTTIIKFEDKSFDTHNAYDVSTGIYTCPAAGLMRVSAQISLSSDTDWAAGEAADLRLVVDGTGTYSFLNITEVQGTDGSLNLTLNGDDLVQVSAGTTLDIRVNQGSGGDVSLLNAGGGAYNHVTFERIGI